MGCGCRKSKTNKPTTYEVKTAEGATTTYTNVTEARSALTAAGQGATLTTVTASNKQRRSR